MHPIKRPGDNINEPSPKRLKTDQDEFSNWDENKIRLSETSELVEKILFSYQNPACCSSKEARKFLTKVGTIRESVLTALVSKCLLKDANEANQNFWMSHGHCQLISDLGKLAPTQSLIAGSECLEILFENVQSTDANTAKCALKGLDRLVSSHCNTLVENKNCSNLLNLALSSNKSDVQALTAKLIGKICAKLNEQPIGQAHQQFCELLFSSFTNAENKTPFNELDQEVLTQLSKILINYLNHSKAASTVSIPHLIALAAAIRWQNQLSAQMIENGCLDLLLSLAKNENLDIKRLAFKGLAFGIYKPPYAKYIADEGFTKETIQAAQDADAELQQHAFGVLAYLAALGQHHAVIKNNSLKVFFNAIQSNSKGEDVLEAATGALTNLLAKERCTIDFYRMGGLKPLFNLLNSDCKLSVKRQIIRALAYMGEVPHLLERQEGLEALNQLKANQFLEKFIQAALTDDLKSVQFSTFGIFKFISRKELSNEVAQYFLESNAIKQLSVLASHPDQYIRKNICWMLVHLQLTHLSPTFLNNNIDEIFSVLFNNVQEQGLEETCISGMTLMVIQNLNLANMHVYEKIVDAFSSVLLKSSGQMPINKCLKGLLSLCRQEKTLSLMIDHPSLPLKLFALKEKLGTLNKNDKFEDAKEKETTKKNYEMASFLIDKMKSQQPTIEGLVQNAKVPSHSSLLSAACLTPEQIGMDGMIALCNYIANYQNQNLTFDNSSELVPPSLLLMALNQLKPPKLVLNNFSQPIEFSFNALDIGKKYSDIILKSEDGKTIPCHRVFLAANSPYFDCLFSSPMKEKDSSEITIHEIDGALLEKVVDCCYSRNIKVDSLSELFYLLSTFAKFQMDTHLAEGLKYLSAIKLSSIGNFEHEEIKAFLESCLHQNDPAILSWITLNWDYWVDGREAWILPFLEKFNLLKESS